MEKVLFREKQQFRQWWMWMLMLSAFTVPLVIIAVNLALNNTDNRNALFIAFSVLLVLEFVFIWLFWSSKLECEITNEQIRFRFLPFIRKWKRINKAEIANYKIRRYKPIAEYGGWGIKVGKRGRGKAYNVSGNIGLQLFLKNGKKILIGTQRKQAMRHALSKVFTEDEQAGFTPNVEVEEKKQFLGKRTKKVLTIAFIEIVLAIIIISLMQIFN